MAQDFIFARDVILDPETRKSVAIIRNGEIFLDDEDGARIAVIVGEHLYDVDGNLLGPLAVAGVLPLSFKNLLKGELARGECAIVV